MTSHDSTNNTVVGALRDTPEGCEIFDGKEWRYKCRLSSQELNNRVFDMLNPKEPRNGQMDKMMSIGYTFTIANKYKRRTFWAWLKNEARELQQFRVIATNQSYSEYEAYNE